MGAWIEIALMTTKTVILPSLPLWERGLKYTGITIYPLGSWSLPLWERGLKYHYTSIMSLVTMSLPLWENRLKGNNELLRNRKQSFYSSMTPLHKQYSSLFSWLLINSSTPIMAVSPKSSKALAGASQKTKRMLATS